MQKQKARLAILIVLIASTQLPMVMGQTEECTTTVVSQANEQLLSKYHILLTTSGLLLDPRLVPDCRTRSSIAALLQRSFVGKLDKADEAFALKHRSEFNQVVLTVWPAIANSPAIPSDGILANEKWTILGDKAVDNDTLNQLVSSDIGVRGLSAEAAYLLLVRLTPPLYGRVSDVVVSPRSSITEKLFGIAVISHQNRSLANHELKKLQGKDLSPVEKAVAARLGARLAAGKLLGWSDVEALADPT
jgi:hypothetical protein